MNEQSRRYGPANHLSVLLIYAVVAVVVIIVAGCSGKEYVSIEDGFTATFPGKVKKEDRTSQSPGERISAISTAYTFEDKSRKMIYEVTVSRWSPDTINDNTISKHIGAWKEYMYLVAERDRSTIAIRELAYERGRCYSMFISTGEFTSETKIFWLKQNDIYYSYYVSVGGASGTMGGNSERVEKFHNSFGVI